MQTLINFSDHDVSITDREGSRRISPYFYDYNGRILIGVQAERAIDLYPEAIFNICTESGEERINAYLEALHRYVTERAVSPAYAIRIDARLTWLMYAARRTLPGITVEIKPDQTAALPERDETDNELQLRNALAIVIANRLLRSCKLHGSLFNRLKRIIDLRIGHYLRELLDQGRASVKLKLVDESRNVRTIDQEIADDIPAAAKLLAWYKHPGSAEEKKAGLAEALYSIYDDNYKVTFISPFSFGKSTLINGLLGEKMLGMDIRAETAIVTKVVSADEKRLFVKYAGGAIIMSTYEDETELHEKLAELTGVRSQDTPEEVQIHHTSEQLPALTIIDAPGLNSRHADHNEKASLAFEISDLILFIINPAHIGEVNFSMQMKEYIARTEDGNKKYGIVLSKLDLHIDDYDVIMNELGIVLKELDPSGFEGKTFFVSGYFALYGKLLRDNKIEVGAVRKSHGIFVIEQDEMLSGRAIQSHHSHSLLAFSQIERLEHFIKERGEPLDSNQFHLDLGRLSAVGQSSYA